MSNDAQPRSALITGASRGIGAVYAERLAQRGYDVLLVARDAARLQALAADLHARTGRSATALPADLTRDDDIARIAALIEQRDDLDLLVNNAGIGSPGVHAIADPEKIDAVLQLNIVALTRLARAGARAFGTRRRGTIVNIASVFALLDEPGFAAYAGSKAYVLHFSRVLRRELDKRGVTVQVVLPGMVATDIWALNGVDPATLPPEQVMSAEDLVDAALAGLDRGEAICIPPLPDLAQWQAFEAARVAMAPNLSRREPAARYGLDAARSPKTAET